MKVLVDAGQELGDIDCLGAERVSHVRVKTCLAFTLLAAIEHVAARGSVEVGVQVAGGLAPCQHNAQLTSLHRAGHGVGATVPRVKRARQREPSNAKQRVCVHSLPCDAIVPYLDGLSELHSRHGRDVGDGDNVNASWCGNRKAAISLRFHGAQNLESRIRPSRKNETVFAACNKGMHTFLSASSLTVAPLTYEASDARRTTPSSWP